MTLAEALAWLTGPIGVGVATYALVEKLPFMGKIANLLLKRLATIGVGLVLLTAGLYLRILMGYLEPFASLQVYLEAAFPVIAEAFGLATLIHGAVRQTRGRSIAGVLANVRPLQE